MTFIDLPLLMYDKKLPVGSIKYIKKVEFHSCQIHVFSIAVRDIPGCLKPIAEVYPGPAV